MNEGLKAKRTRFKTAKFKIMLFSELLNSGSKILKNKQVQDTFN